jgi:hypothetical protein
MQLIKYKKLESHTNEFGDERGNCSGLINSCLKTKLYLTCKKPCIKIIKTCEDCRWAKKIVKQFHFISDDYYSCYYNPPTTEPIYYGDNAGISYYSQIYPTVYKESLCSKFETREDICDE